MEISSQIGDVDFLKKSTSPIEKCGVPFCFLHEHISSSHVSDSIFKYAFSIHSYEFHIV